MTIASTMTVTVQWGDCDPAQIVFYPNYFYWFDSATQMLLQHVVMPKRDLLERYGIIGFPLVEASARFVRPSRVGQDIAIESVIASCDGKRFTVAHRGNRDGALLFEGQEVRFAGRVHADDPERLRAIPLPEELMAAFGHPRPAAR